MKIFIKNKSNNKKPNLVPLINIVFLLLIFFMLASEFTDFKTIDMTSPSETNTNIENKNKPIIVNLSPEGKIKVNNKIADLNNLNTTLKNILKDDNAKKIIISTPENTKVNILVKTIDIIRNLGIDNIALVTKEQE